MKKNNKTLCLPLKKEWYEMIESGVKTEEYREIKDYWIKRFSNIDRNNPENQDIDWSQWECYRFRRVRFSYGYTKRTMTFELEKITIGKGNPEWGAPDEYVFIIHIGKRV